MNTWFNTADSLPPRGRGLWFFPDRSMYVYFVPKAWRYLSGGA